MKLYLLRHGHSPTPIEAGVSSDAERPLSDQGRRGVIGNVERLKRLGGRPEVILHSPLRRAVETAREAARLLCPGSGVWEYAPLANQLSAQELLERLSGDAVSQVKELLLVGHQPQLGELAALLSRQVFDLKPGGLIALESGKEKPASILWSANPGDVQP